MRAMLEWRRHQRKGRPHGALCSAHQPAAETSSRGPHGEVRSEASNHEVERVAALRYAHSPARAALWAFFLAIAPMEQLRPVRTLRGSGPQDGVYCCYRSLTPSGVAIHYDLITLECPR